MVSFEIEKAKLDRRIRQIITKSQKPNRLFRRIFAHQQTQSGLMFRRLRHGGTHRGVSWPPFAPQYTRKTDGATVPAWGGVPRIDGEGAVQGRLRPSKTRIDPNSNLMRDTGLLASAVASAFRVRRRGTLLEIHTPLRYAAPQQAMRPFTFFTRADLKLYQGWALEEVVG